MTISMNIRQPNDAPGYCQGVAVAEAVRRARLRRVQQLVPAANVPRFIQLVNFTELVNLGSLRAAHGGTTCSLIRKHDHFTPARETDETSGPQQPVTTPKGGMVL